MKKLLKWIPALIIMGTIFYFSSRQGILLAPTYFWNYLAHKGAHMFWYGFLALSYFMAVKNLYLSILFATLFGVSDEIHQMFVPTRTGRISDVVIDFTASCFMMVAVYVFCKLGGKKIRS